MKEDEGVTESVNRMSIAINEVKTPEFKGEVLK